MISRVEYGGWANTVKLSNGQIELVATLDVGPRIIHLGFVGGQNLFKNYPAQMGKAGEAEWQIRGGHRFWHAPEAKPRTYALDNSPVTMAEVDASTIRLTQEPESENSVQKIIDITMDDEENTIVVTHQLYNYGAWAIELAPWALTVMDVGGTCIVPLPEKRPHSQVLAPEFPLVLWPYTDMADSRLHWGTHYFTLSQDPAKGPTKFGMANQLGWAAYLLNGTLMVKYFDYEPCALYPDFGCNFETFTNEDMLEVESLGPLTVLEPGDMVEHVETWKLFANVPAITDEASIDAIIRPLVEG